MADLAQKQTYRSAIGLLFGHSPIWSAGSRLAI